MKKCHSSPLKRNQWRGLIGNSVKIRAFKRSLDLAFKLRMNWGN